MSPNLQVVLQRSPILHLHLLPARPEVVAVVLEEGVPVLVPVLAPAALAPALAVDDNFHSEMNASGEMIKTCSTSVKS